MFVAGCIGYINSHARLELINSVYKVVVYDNFSNGTVEAIYRVEKLTSKILEIIEGDVRDKKKICRALKDTGSRAIIHFAGLKAVGGSVELPLDYYENNVIRGLSLLRALKQVDVTMLVFSSSATVYGTPPFFPSQKLTL